MTEQLTTVPGNTKSTTCTPADRVTKSLLGYGIIAGPLYVVVALTQALTRQGFDLGLHQWSLLANGAQGWIQITNFVVTGLMVDRLRGGTAPGPHPGAGCSLGAPVDWCVRGQPDRGRYLPGRSGARVPGRHTRRSRRRSAGTDCCTSRPAASDSPAWLLPAASSAAGIAMEGDRGWAVFSRLTGVVFLAGFAMVASSGGSRPANLIFTAAVILVWAWMTAVAAGPLPSRRASHPPPLPSAPSTEHHQRAKETDHALHRAVEGH